MNRNIVNALHILFYAYLYLFPKLWVFLEGTCDVLECLLIERIKHNNIGIHAF